MPLGWCSPEFVPEWVHLFWGGGLVVIWRVTLVMLLISY
jgi:hypothetical protein